MKLFLISQYQPESRAWGRKEFQISEILQQIQLFYNLPLRQSTTIGLAMAIPFVDRNLSFIGTGGFDFSPSSLLKRVTQKFGKDFTYIFLASLDGILIMHPFNITSDKIPLYFYNESITGFTLQDWQSLSDPTFVSSCLNQTKTMDFKCLYNSFYNKDMFISRQNLESFNTNN